MKKTLWLAVVATLGLPWIAKAREELESPQAPAQTLEEFRRTPQESLQGMRVAEEKRSSEKKGAIRLPLLGEGKRKPYALSSLNKELEAAGSNIRFPDTIDIASEEYGRRALDQAEINLENASKALGRSLELFKYGSPGDYTSGSHPLCYLGSPDKAVELIASLADSAFSDQLGVVAWKYRSKAHLLLAEDIGKEEAQETAELFPKLWREWEGGGEAILLITVQNDSGDDFTASIIGKCRG